MAEEVNNAEPVQPEPVQLSLQDIATCVQIIDLCSKRGSFEGPELEVVGGLRTRLVSFVQANQPAEEPAAEGQVPEVEAEPVEEDSK
tara:strand:- start:8749 stop:9009 length:261 start_codon:yes stop_codon:yes gene_type:complete